MSSERELEIVLLGATGYTGRTCAEYIVKNLPTDLRWGIAGRSTQKLQRLASELKTYSQDRNPAELFQVQLNDKELGALARKTKVLISCVGPYVLHGAPVVKACAVNGTHYADVTGEFLWVKKMIGQFHETAKSSGAILLSADGVESAPPDLLTWLMANFIKENYGVRTKEVIMSLYDMKGAGPSGGTLGSILENAGTGEYQQNHGPYDLSLSKPSVKQESTPILQRIFGAHFVSDIGVVTTCIPAGCDEAIVHRTSSLIPELYDPNFRFREYMKARNFFTGVVAHFIIVMSALALCLSPVRWFARKLVYGPGEGPADDNRLGSRVEYRGIARASHSDNGGNDIRVLGTFVYEGCPYTMTGVLLAEAAMVLARSKRVSREIKGGYVTPASLEQEYIDRLEKAGINFQVRVLKR